MAANYHDSRPPHDYDYHHDPAKAATIMPQPMSQIPLEKVIVAHAIHPPLHSPSYIIIRHAQFFYQLWTIYYLSSGGLGLYFFFIAIFYIPSIRQTMSGRMSVLRGAEYLIVHISVMYDIDGY